MELYYLGDSDCKIEKKKGTLKRQNKSVIKATMGLLGRLQYSANP